MRVVLVSMARRGGMVHFLAELANALAPLCETTVIIADEAEESYLSRDVDRVRIKTGRDAPRRLLQTLNPVTWYRLWSALRSLRADVIHIVGVHQWNPAIALLSKSRNSLLVYTVHDPDPHPQAPFTIAAADRLAARFADHAVVLTRTGRARLYERGWSQSRVHVIPLPAFTMFERWRPRRRAKQRTILYFGRVEAYKGLEVLLEAFQTIRPRLPGWKLVIAGHGRLPSSVDTSAMTGLEIHNKYISDQEASGLMYDAAMVVLPYTSASQSGVAALAQAFGRPIVASAVGGLREMVIHGRTGLLVPPGDPGPLADALESLAKGPRRLKDMGRATAEMARTTWSPRTVAAAHAKFYARALKRRART